MIRIPAQEQEITKRSSAHLFIPTGGESTEHCLRSAKLLPEIALAVRRSIFCSTIAHRAEVLVEFATVGLGTGAAVIENAKTAL
ncbi:MAG: hypothetical protein AAGI27_08330 [Pseudomonadota bacterium]